MARVHRLRPNHAPEPIAARAHRMLFTPVRKRIDDETYQIRFTPGRPAYMAGCLARRPVWSIIRPAGQALSRRRLLGSNVRRPIHARASSVSLPQELGGPDGLGRASPGRTGGSACCRACASLGSCGA